MDRSSVQILMQSLEKKCQILDKIIDLNAIQEDMLKQEEFNMDGFEETIDRQNDFVAQLDRLDEGFETLYERVRTDIIANKASYASEIKHMQNLVGQITDKIVVVNSGNMRNKMLAENQFKKQRQEIRKSVTQSTVARNYYNSANKLNYVQPQFYDSKK